MMGKGQARDEGGELGMRVRAKGKGRGEEGFFDCASRPEIVEARFPGRKTLRDAPLRMTA